MQECPDNLLYTDSHEWVSVEGDIATIGITNHAQSLMGELVFIELPELDDNLARGDDAGVVESVKTASDFYNPISGTVVEVNSELHDEPKVVNEQPYGDGWLYKIKIEDTSELKELLDADTYHAKFVEE